MTNEHLVANADETAFLLRGSNTDLFIDRMFGGGDRLDHIFNCSGIRDLHRYGYLGYII